jgi:hypothetical protein
MEGDLLVELSLAVLVKKFTVFYGIEVSLPSSQLPTTDKINNFKSSLFL